MVQKTFTFQVKISVRCKMSAIILSTPDPVGNRISVKILLFSIILAEHCANSEQVEKMTGMKRCQDMQTLKN